MLAIEVLVSPWSHRMLVARAELSDHQIARLWQRSVVSLLPR